MMGRLNHDQKQFFYSFSLDDAVPDDHPVREIAAAACVSFHPCAPLSDSLPAFRAAVNLFYPA
jgi:hypothetical protein